VITRRLACDHPTIAAFASACGSIDRTIFTCHTYRVGGNAPCRTEHAAAPRQGCHRQPWHGLVRTGATTAKKRLILSIGSAAPTQYTPRREPDGPRCCLPWR